MGRQPWIVQGLLKTADANSPASSTTWLAISLAVFVSLYLRCSSSTSLMRRYAGRDPAPAPEGRATARRRPGAGGRATMDLQTLWFILIAVLWGGYFLLEGFDFGVGMLLPFLPRNERRAADDVRDDRPGLGRQRGVARRRGRRHVRRLPGWYATMFSGFYIALLLVLVLLIVRVLSFEWREKSESPRWRPVWLWANAIGSVGASLIWGIALANLLHGVPLDSKRRLRRRLRDLFTGYSVLAGVTVVLVFAFHGATYLTIRTRGELCERAARAARRLSVPPCRPAPLLAWTVVVAVDRNDKDVFPPVLPAALGVAALVLAVVFVVRRRSGWASRRRRSGPSCSWRRCSRASTRA